MKFWIILTAVMGVLVICVHHSRLPRLETQLHELQKEVIRLQDYQTKP